jgi:hypothetical protein
METRYRSSRVLSCRTAVALLSFALISAATAQEPRTQVLIGTLNQETKASHFYAIDASLVNQVYKADSPLVSRIFVAATTKSDCCSPLVKLSPNCWKCCDGRYITTDDATYGKLIEEISKTSEAAWELAREKAFYDVPRWPQIAAALATNPPSEIPPDDPRSRILLKNLKQ